MRRLVGVRGPQAGGLPAGDRAKLLKGSMTAGRRCHGRDIYRDAVPARACRQTVIFRRPPRWRERTPVFLNPSTSRTRVENLRRQTPELAVFSTLCCSLLRRRRIGSRSPRFDAGAPLGGLVDLVARPPGRRRVAGRPVARRARGEGARRTALSSTRQKRVRPWPRRLQKDEAGPVPDGEDPVSSRCAMMLEH